MQILRFLVVGALNTSIGFFTIFAMMYWFKVDYRLANASGFAVGCVVSFTLNRRWTFQHKGDLYPSLILWLAILVLSYGLNLAALVAMHKVAGANKYLAQFGGMFVYTAVMFLGSRYVVFRARKPVLAGEKV